MRNAKDIYRGMSPIDAPAYTPAVVAHHLCLPVTTVRYWTLGRDRYRPVIVLADPKAHLLSFRNLVEIHVLSAVRRRHAVTLPAVRKAVEYLRRAFGSMHPLSDEKMKTDGKHLFVEKFGQLINASKEGQLAMEELLEAHLKRVERDDAGLPVRLFPFTRIKPEGPQSVVIDPRVQFGRPCIAGTGVPTAVVVERFKAGEALSSLAEDYGRAVSDIEEAIRYETDLQAA
jgi:uncharacterized protein (DUF433 family)